MTSPSQALLWNAFKLSWPALVTQITGAVTVIFIIDLAIKSGSSSSTVFEAADLVILISFNILYVATLNGMHKSGRVRSSLGFPYRVEFAYPVSTGILAFTPLLYFCILAQVAVFVPGIIVNFLILDTQVSYLPISFVVFQFTIVTLMLSWWTNNGLACLAGWAITIYLFVYSYLIPDFTRLEDSWFFEVSSPTEYISPILFTVALLVLYYFGVRQQRSGETLLSFGKVSQDGQNTIDLREAIPIPSTPCPTDAPLKAEIWKERSLNGVYRAVIVSLGGAGVILGIFSIISFFVPGEGNIVIGSIAIGVVAIYLSVCVALTTYMFGVRYKNGVASVSIHDKTIPMSTAKLTLIRVTVSLLSTLVAGLVISVVLWVLGPILITDFVDIRGQFLESLDFLAELSFLAGALRITLLLLAFLTGIFLFAIFLTWFMLQSKKMSITVTALAIYTFLLVNGLIAFTNEGEFNRVLDSVARAHLWIVISLIPLGIVAMLRKLLRGCVIDRTQLLWMCGIGATIQLLNLVWLFGANNYDAMNIDITLTLLSYFIAQGFLPLFAAALALWTSDKIRHG